MAQRPSASNQAFVLFGLLLGLGLFIILMLSNWLFWYLNWLLGWSITLFILYGIDKAQAGLKRSRVPEVLLHSLALIGGFAGGWLGMMLFHHKTSQANFKIILLLATALGGALLYQLMLS